LKRQGHERGATQRGKIQAPVSPCLEVTDGKNTLLPPENLTPYDHHIYTNLDFWDARRILGPLALVKQKESGHLCNSLFNSETSRSSDIIFVILLNSFVSPSMMHPTILLSSMMIFL